MNYQNDITQAALEAARKSSVILMERFGNIKEVINKNQVFKEFVTDVDFQVESEIIKIIKNRFPDHSILSEEAGELSKDSEYKWIIDPVDGTHNYARKLPTFGVSIALEHKGNVILGVIALPYFQEIFIAEKGKGAYLNGEKIHVSDAEMGQALMIYDTKIRVDKGPMVSCLGEFINKIFIIRMFGCSTWDLCCIARGQAEFNIDFTAKPWDMAAGALIVEEAGGKVTDLGGNPWNSYVKGFTASNGKVHNDIVNITRKYT